LKRIAAIVLLALFAFNLFGYKLLMNLLELRASVSLQQKLDRDQYDNSNLVEIKVPVNLPYLSNWSTFEKYQGETEINGVHYKYVKRKLVNDTLILLCIPNETKNELRTAQSDYFKQVNDLQGTSKKSGDNKDHQSKSPVNDYILKEGFAFSANHLLSTTHYSLYNKQLATVVLLVKEQPPEC
jgi:hypothetical protein